LLESVSGSQIKYNEPLISQQAAKLIVQVLVKFSVIIKPPESVHKKASCPLQLA